MSKDNTTTTEKKVRYIASVLYILVMIFIVGGSYLHQQDKVLNTEATIELKTK